MDHVRLLKEIISKNNLDLAYHYALYDRIRKDYYFDYFEIEYALNNKEKIIDELIDELKDIESYTPRPAYAFYPPKNDLCYRRMVYVPFKDILVRYAIVIIFSKYLDNELLDSCFANRKAKDEHSKISLLEDFATTSWPNFCSWQRKNIEKYKVLLRTDISAFYDSISHKELINKISKELSVEPTSNLMKLFKKILEIPVISYSNLNKIVEEPKIITQGIPIGNSVEGFLANLYLKNIDEAMQSLEDIEFGRYNDDMRIFGNNRQEVLHSLLILQEKLLANGLNLNSSKTEIAEDIIEMEDLRSKFYEFSGDFYFEDDISEEENNTLIEHIDLNFDEFDKIFKPDASINSNKEAKNYCKFLTHTNKEGKKLLPNSERLPIHIEKLKEIIIKWQGSSKHASWLIVQSAFYSDIPPETKKKALEVIFKLLSSSETNSYAKYRILHHILKLRKKKDGREFRFLDYLDEKLNGKLIDIIPSLIKIPAFEINITVLYLLKVLGKTNDEIKDYINKYAIKPLGEPIKNILFYLSDEESIDKKKEIVSDYEPDDIDTRY